MSLAKNPDGAYRALEGDHDLDLEVIGDIHATDIENHKEYLTDKYDSGELDGILVTGDLATNPTINPQIIRDDVEDLADYRELLDENVGALDDIGEELDVDLYSVPGNHDPIKGAHPGNESDIERFEETLNGVYDEFADFDGNYYEFLIEQSDNIQDVSHGLAEIGDYTVVGGGSHFSPEVDPQELEEAYETKEVEVQEEAKASDLATGPVKGLAALGAAPFGKSVGKETRTVTEEYIPDEKKEELSDYFEKYDELESLIEEAGDNVIALDHGIPYGSGMDDTEKGYQGSLVWRDLIEEHSDKMAGFVGGHFHGGGESEINDMQIFNVGEGQYRELGITDKDIDYLSYSYEDTGGEAPPEKRPNPQAVQQQPQKPQRPAGLGVSGQQPQLNPEVINQHADQISDDRVPEELIEEVIQNRNVDRETAIRMIKQRGAVQDMIMSQMEQEQVRQQTNA